MEKIVVLALRDDSVGRDEAEKLATWLETEVTRSRKQRRTLRQIHTAAGLEGVMSGFFDRYDRKDALLSIAALP